MSQIIDRIRSIIVEPKEANKKLSDLIIELRARGIQFRIEIVIEDGKKYFLAKSVNYPRGTIITSGENLIKLSDNIRDAIFTAFEIPKNYCNPAIIELPGLPKAIEENQLVHASA